MAQNLTINTSAYTPAQWRSHLEGRLLEHRLVSTVRDQSLMNDLAMFSGSTVTPQGLATGTAMPSGRNRQRARSRSRGQTAKIAAAAR